MAEDNVTSIEQQEGPGPAGYAEAATVFQDGLGALIASSHALINSSQTMQGALLAFWQSRAKESLAVGQRLAECGSPQNAVEIQLDFARESLQAYADQFVRWSALAGESLHACVRPFQSRAAAPSDRASDLAA